MLSRLTTRRPAIGFRAFKCSYTTKPSNRARDIIKPKPKPKPDPNWRTKGQEKNIPAENIKNLVAQWQSEGDRYVSYENLATLDGKLAQFSADRTIAEKAQLLSELTLTYFARSDINSSQIETAFRPDNFVHTTGILKLTDVFDALLIFYCDIFIYFNLPSHTLLNIICEKRLKSILPSSLKQISQCNS